MITFWITFLLTIQIIHFLGTWKLYELAGRKWWEAAIPLYSHIVALKIINRPWWWLFILFIPVISPILMLVIIAELAISFGKKSTNELLLVIFSLGLYLFYLNYIEKPTYQRIESRKETFISSVLFAVVVATFIHTFIIQPYTIPTQSMEKTLQVGDFIFVSKFNYGIRIPMTPIGIPFLQSALPFSGAKSYVDKVRLPYLRLPKLQEVKRNDIVVFNFPADSVHNAIDRKDPYVKRCVGMPGDFLKIVNGELFINQKLHLLPANGEKQYAYYVFTDIPFSEKIIEKTFEFLEYDFLGEDKENNNVYVMYLSDNNLKKIKDFGNVKKIERMLAKKEETIKRVRHNGTIDTVNSIFPVDKNWNVDHYGPLYIPKKGDIIKLSKENITQYLNIIKKYEHNALSIKGDEIIINGKIADTYTIKQNYYFMMGDNRYRSLDSRFFGYVPEDHVFGKPLFRWLSIEWRNGKKLRLDRMMMPITQSNNPKPKSYLLFVSIGLGLYFLVDFIIRNRKQKK